MTALLRNCRFAFKCEKTWKLLEPTGTPSIKYCGDCERKVYLCTSDEELATAIQSNRCVAIPEEGTKPGRGPEVGMITGPEYFTEDLE